MISAVLSSPPWVFLRCGVRSGCDEVTCWDGACPCHCLPEMEWLTHGAFLSTVPAAFLCTDFWCLPGARAPRLYGRVVQGAAPGCYLHHAGAELLLGWGWAWMDPSHPPQGWADSSSFGKGGVWSDWCLPGWAPVSSGRVLFGLVLHKQPRQGLCLRPNRVVSALASAGKGGEGSSKSYCLLLKRKQHLY